MWYAVSVLHTGQYIYSPEWGGRGGGEGVWWCWLVDLVLMLEQKTMRKGTFFFKLGSAQRCHLLGSEKRRFSGKRARFRTSAPWICSQTRSRIQIQNIVLKLRHCTQDSNTPFTWFAMKPRQKLTYIEVLFSKLLRKQWTVLCATKRKEILQTLISKYYGNTKVLAMFLTKAAVAFSH